ncbi:MULTISPECIES: anaerobic ribonucleoside-triphosphate reductase activating protein [unclassified Clostridium]|jgi:anaerobic ribonucleoside-triphosphate reductase activating protein|uniref:anaerobic ribonucleoside-triphosphate reductase activating protein n=1 Tax=unclassified Clostridium TaxID=2614128 RepID=UPI000E4B1B43|nr:MULTISPECIES: anaerobic ribonucleoside-triphosphate reductase activating protein [unclassified Clostridium]RHS87368.1 anaerobic ribonucleoside-triphosphate reductase activating protein [Clostridium sp. AM42-4]RHV88930.1 anaerobic ribonucleoside-triphosphate reductase activating protein [Clostridium sp. OF09-36]HBM48045.1 anaerobic ribonucleoside-triphosphate reductase activating protein [Lachnoclostridium sp.]
MKYAQVFTCDIANGPGCRTSLFVSGCTHHCKDCFNEVAWDFNYGREFDSQVQDELIKESRPSYIDGFTFLGGEPMEVANQKALRPFLERIRTELPGKNIWIYSGYTYEELTDPHNTRCHSEDTDAILAMTDVLVDGRFELDKKDITLRFRGSSNQRVIDVPETRKNGHIVLSKYGEKEKLL